MARNTVELFNSGIRPANKSGFMMKADGINRDAAGPKVTQGTDLRTQRSKGK